MNTDKMQKALGILSDAVDFLAEIDEPSNYPVELTEQADLIHEAVRMLLIEQRSLLQIAKASMEATIKRLER